MMNKDEEKRLINVLCDWKAAFEIMGKGNEKRVIDLINAANMIAQLSTECDNWKHRAEAAESDLLILMKKSEWGCKFCKNRVDSMCCSCSECEPKWRGVCGRSDTSATE